MLRMMMKRKPHDSFMKSHNGGKCQSEVDVTAAVVFV